MSKEKQITIRLPSIEIRSPQLFFALTLLAFALVFGYWFFFKRPFLTIERAKLEAFSTTIHSDTPGRIALMGPKEGDFVKQGDKLFILENEELVRKHLRGKEILERLEKNLNLEKKKVEEAMQAYLALTNNFDSLTQDSVQKHIDQMEKGQVKVETLVQEINKAKAVMEKIDQECKSYFFSAPFAGTILKRAKNPGSVISFGEPLYILCDMSKLWVETEISEKDLSKISLGTQARIRLCAYPKKEFKGEVSYIGAATTQKSSIEPIREENQTIPIKVSIETQNLLLKPGLTATVDLKVR